MSLPRNEMLERLRKKFSFDCNAKCKYFLFYVLLIQWINKYSIERSFIWCNGKHEISFISLQSIWFSSNFSRLQCIDWTPSIVKNTKHINSITANWEQLFFRLLAMIAEWNCVWRRWWHKNHDNLLRTPTCWWNYWFQCVFVCCFLLCEHECKWWSTKFLSSRKNNETQFLLS